LLATKARVLVTNSIAFVKQFDSLIFLRRGIILESGSYRELVADAEREISKLMYVHNHISS
jgi:ABC-type transport system involved in cytochrome bd biosynthesis fused ATPase/permease subunit